MTSFEPASDWIARSPGNSLSIIYTDNNEVPIGTDNILTRWQWLRVGDDLLILATDLRCWWHFLNVDDRCQYQKIVDVGDQNGYNHHQHLQFVSNIRHQHRCNPVTIWPYREQMVMRRLKFLVFGCKLGTASRWKLYQCHQGPIQTLFLRNLKSLNWRIGTRSSESTLKMSQKP